MLNIFEQAEYYLLHVLELPAKDCKSLLKRFDKSIEIEMPISKGQISDLEYWDVKGKSGTYRVITNGSSFPSCTCPDWQHRFRASIFKDDVVPTPCKHGLRVLLNRYGGLYARKASAENGRAVFDGADG